MIIAEELIEKIRSFMTTPGLKAEIECNIVKDGSGKTKTEIYVSDENISRGKKHVNALEIDVLQFVCLFGKEINWENGYKVFCPIRLDPRSGWIISFFY